MSENPKNSAEFAVAQETLQAAFDIDFGRRLEDTFTDAHPVVGSVVKGVVVNVDSEAVTIDIGLKTEGKIPLKEFEDFNTGDVKVAIGDLVDVFVENLDDRKAEARLSREKARREEVMAQLEGAQKANEPVKGVIFGKVKGGFMVDMQGVLGFLPGSQLDAKPITDASPYMYTPLDFQVVKVDRKRNNLIVSRRALTEDGTLADRDSLLSGLKEGTRTKGTVKNITDYGAFLDLGGIDGLLHITDIAWHRIGHPSEVLKVGQVVDVVVTRFDEKTQRVSLGMKQLNDDPWKSVDKTYPIGNKVTGKVTNLTDYGAFVELAPGVEGLIHVTEMSWTKKNVHPSRILQSGQTVTIQVLEIDRDKRRISLGLKQCMENPWEAFTRAYKQGDKVSGTVRSMTDFGLFVALTEEIDGLVHVSDIAWDKAGDDAMAAYKKGDKVEAVILSIDTAKERVALGIKQLTGEGPAGGKAEGGVKKGDIVTVKVTDTDADSITVDLNGAEIIIKARDLGVAKAEQDPNKFKEGQEIQAKVISTMGRKVGLSIRALVQDEERAAVAEYANQEESGESALAAALKAAGAKSKAKAPKAEAAAAADDAEAAPKAKKAPAKKKAE
ncbi:MAG: 30S ribosomal protein S1 [Alphaproteobacteria bacterium]|nr:30S ribosomal protein S1 [Alphaproteobacteria bacterium]